MLYEVCGPSGVGKNAIVERLTTNRFITTTTRIPRKDEVSGVDYYFVPKDEFETSIKNNEFIEWASYTTQGITNYYGLKRTLYEETIAAGDVFIIVDIQGVLKYKEIDPTSKSILIHAPFEDVKNQIIKRGGDQKTINERISIYERDMEDMKKHDFDYVFLNHFGQLDQTIENIKKTLNIKRKH